MENNTTFDYEQEGKELPSKEEILQNEDEMIAGLLEAAAFKSDDSLQKKIEIRRNGKLLFSFFVRPLTEEEIKGCRRKATKRRPDPRGRQFGMIELETDYYYGVLKEKLEENSYKEMGSCDAGNYLCNNVFYRALDFKQNNNLKTKIAFIHIPTIDNIENTLELNSALNSLSAIEQSVLFLLFKEDLSQDDAAKILEICSKSVSRIKLRAIDKLKKYLKEDLEAEK